MKPFIRVLLLMSVAMPVNADTALVVGTVDASATTSYGAPRYVGTALQPLQNAGFTVHSAIDADAATLRGLITQLVAMNEDDRMVIMLAGRFAHFGGLTWFLGRDAGVQGLGSVSGTGIPVQLLLDIAADSDGSAIILLGAEDQGVQLGAGLTEGVGELTVPQGVTLATGHPAAVARFASRELLVQGRPIRDAFARAPGLNVLALHEPFRPFIASPVATPTIPPADQSYWEAMVALNNAFAYQAYLNRYPGGYYAAEARNRIAALQPTQPPTPQLNPEQVENALGLSRNQRRDIQRDLALLSYYTSGIDGLFGPGSRGAIRSWQQANGFAVTGYLDATQISRLSDQGDVRRAEISAQDRAYWQQTGSGSDEAGMRAYLNRYPNGQFATIARERIAAMEEARAEQEDIAYWNQTGQGNSEAGLRAYLQRYPQGQFAQLARQRLANIEAQQDQAYWQQTGANGSEAGLRAYLNRYPNGAFAQTARQQLNALTGAGNEAAAWQAARNQDTISAYEQYLNAYPNGAHRGQAHQQINAIRADNQTWQQARSADTAEAYRDYLTAYPNGRHEAEARQLLQAIRADHQAWRDARDAGTRAALQGYLNDYPNGRHVQQAQTALNALPPAQTDPAIGQMSNAHLQLAATQLRRVGYLPNSNVNEAQIVAGLRRYQSDRGLANTGLMDQATTALLFIEALAGN